MSIEATAVRRGWRGFFCDCGHTWKQATRDFLSPSVETCPKCGADERPIGHWPDPKLACDASGNLIGSHEPQSCSLKEAEMESPD